MSTKTRVLNVRVVGFSAPERQMLNSIFLLSVAPARQIGYKLWNPDAGVAPDMYLLDGDSDSAVASWQATFSSTSDRTLVVGSKNLDLGVASASRPLGLKVVGAMDRLAIALQNPAPEVPEPRARTLPTGTTSRQPALSVSMNAMAPVTSGHAASITMTAASNAATGAGTKLSTAAATATLAGSTLSTAAATAAQAAQAAQAPMTATAPAATVLPNVTLQPNIVPGLETEKPVTDRAVDRILSDNGDKADKADKADRADRADKTLDKPTLPPSSGATPLSPSALAAAVAPSTSRTNLRVVPNFTSTVAPLAASLPAAARIGDLPMNPSAPAAAPVPEAPVAASVTAPAATSAPVAGSTPLAAVTASAAAPAAAVNAAPAATSASLATPATPAPIPVAPVAAAPSVPPAAPPLVVPSAPTARHEEHNFRVLAVDDSPLMRTFLQNKLQPYGIQPEFASSGEEALFKISKQHYDMIFLDVMLPGMDGYDVCKMIKKNKDNSLMKVVMLTSKDKTFDKIRGTMAGCDGYLTKPVDEMKLRAIIERHTVTRK
jgi:CheY-like chemotaxis protein